MQSAFPWSPRSGADTAAGPTPLFDLSRHESDVGDLDAALARPTQGLPALGSRKSSANAPLPPFKPAPVVAAPQAEDSKPGPDAGAPGNQLYVNRGIGFSMLPVRFSCPPELTVFTLYPA